ncbi:HEAT repeat-containing protein OS=Streptomyces microflavus OX=1919 GN=Smic_15530 PE=4 SV=1 [Streptomyces microflavus]
MAALCGWVALFDAWSLVHAAPEGIETGAVAEAVEAVPQVLSLLQLSAGPVSVPALLDLLAQRIAELHEERCEVPYGAGRTAGDGDQAAGRPTPAQDRGADLDALLSHCPMSPLRNPVENHCWRCAD